MKWLAIATVVLFAGAAQATTIVALPERELVARANVIAFGTVLRTETVVNARGQVFTQAELQVHQGFRGVRANEFLLVQVPGGPLPNGLEARTVGAPRLAAGQLVFGFFEQRDGTVRPLGLAFGLLRVRTNTTGELRVFREADELALVNERGEGLHPEQFVVADVPLIDYGKRINTHLAALGLPQAELTVGLPTSVGVVRP